MLKFWSQSFLANIPKVVCGFRSQKGVIESVKEYETLTIPRLARDLPNTWVSE
jgi:RAT1-interacting protein